MKEEGVVAQDVTISLEHAKDKSGLCGGAEARPSGRFYPASRYDLPLANYTPVGDPPPPPPPTTHPPARSTRPALGVFNLKGVEAAPPAIARWHAHARTNGGLASVYGRVGPEGREHCAACAGMPETTMHVYRQCPRYAAPRAHLTRAVDEWCTDATTRGARPTREDALRWVHDNAMANGSGAPLAAMLAGDLLRTAAYTFWKAARKLRWVCKGIRTGSGLEARPQAAADGAREAATPTANAAGLQPTQDNGAETPSDHQQPPAPGAATRAL
jgi:hypothetical protein